MFKNVFLYCALAISVGTNLLLAGIVIQRLPPAPPSVVVVKAPLVPVIRVSPAAPPIHAAVPLPKPKPVVQHAERKPKAKKVRAKKTHSVTVTEKLATPSVTKAAPKVTKVKAKTKPIVVAFDCSQVPSWITSISPATIRSEGLARNYAPATLDKVIACRKSMGGSG